MADKKDYKTLRLELDEILSKLQDEDVAIDDAVALYERGMALTKELERYLSQAENMITKLQAKFDQKA